MTAWSDLISAQIAYVADLEQRLKDDAWDAPIPSPPVPPAVAELGAPTSSDVHAIYALMARRERLVQELSERRSQTREELSELATRRAAGRSYAAH